MAWMTLGEALESALASALNGEGTVAVDPVSPKKAAGTAQAPAQVQEVVQTERGTTPVKTQPATKATSLGNAKRGRTHPKASEPPLGVRPRLVLVVDNERGSGPAWVEGGRAPGRLRAGGEEGGPARKLVLVR